MREMLRAVAGAALLTFAVASAHAQFFKDEEARKAIVDMRARLTPIEDSVKAQETKLSELAQAQTQAQAQVQALTTLTQQLTTQLNEQMAALRRSLVDLSNQLEAMRGEMAKLRGSDEQLARDVAELQRRTRDVGQTLDDRLRRLEPVKVTIDGREYSVDQEEKRAFDEAMGLIRAGDFDRAVAALGTFQRRYAGSPYTAQARFWQGNALYGKRDYKEAITVFRAFVAGAPDHPRAPEALLAVANSQAEMKDPRGARRTIDELIKAYPQSEAAQAGRDRLASLK